MNGSTNTFFLSFFKRVVDLLSVILLYFLFSSNGNLEEGILNRQNLQSLIVLLLFWVLLNALFRVYRGFRISRFIDYYKSVLFSSVSFVLFSIFFLPLFSPEYWSFKSASIFALVYMFWYLSLALFFFYGVKFYRKQGYNFRRVIIVGYNESVEELIELINSRKDFGLRLEGVFVKKRPGEMIDDDIKFYYLSELKDSLDAKKIDYAYLSVDSDLNKEELRESVNLMEEYYLTIAYLPEATMEWRANAEMKYLDTIPMIFSKKYPLDFAGNRFFKRVFDLVFFAVIFVFVLWWLIPLISLLVFFSQGRPIFFAQKRNGLNGKEFSCYKFRTMRPDKDNNRRPTERDDPRVTKLGRVLRKTSLDELPQFFNVLKGDMSIVGPRPHMISENESYSEIIRRYSLRHYVKPGITGLAQIKGYRGAIDDTHDMELRVRTDIYYVRNWSFLLDLFIIYKTFMLMIKGDENAI